MQTGFLLFFRSEDVTDSSTGAASFNLAIPWLKIPGNFWGFFENLAGSVRNLISAIERDLAHSLMT